LEWIGSADSPARKESQEPQEWIRQGQAEYKGQAGVLRTRTGRAALRSDECTLFRQVDQAQLETVIPQPGGAVLVVNGAFRGAKASLLEVDTSKFQAKVAIRGGEFDGRERWCEYEDICKLHG
jgi:transcription antitermination factor NusG